MLRDFEHVIHLLWASEHYIRPRILKGGEKWFFGEAGLGRGVEKSTLFIYKAQL